MAPSRPCTSTRRSLSYGKVLATRRATPRTACAKWRSTVAVTECPAKHHRRARSYCPSLDHLLASHRPTSLPSGPSRPPRPPSRLPTSSCASCRNTVHIWGYLKHVFPAAWVSCASSGSHFPIVVCFNRLLQRTMRHSPARAAMRSVVDTMVGCISRRCPVVLCATLA